MQINRESIFIGTVRSFCTGFAIFSGILFALVVGFLVVGFLNSSDLLPPKANVTILQDGKGNREILSSYSPVILRIDIHGTIGDMYLTAADVENLLLDSRENLLQHNRVKGILLHIDTPGGTVTDSSIIHQLLLDYKAKYQVPIYAYVDGMCASGGMYIACASDKIFATPWSLVGSVGVILAPHFNFSKIMDKWGIEAVTLTQGKDKDPLNPYRPWKPDEASSLQPIMAGLYDQFVTAVIKGRPQLNRQKIIEDYGARVFLAQTAMEYDYIDSISSNYLDVVRALATSAGISPEEHYQVVQLSPPHNILVDLAKAKSLLFQGKITHRIQVYPSLPNELCGQPLYLYLPQ